MRGGVFILHDDGTLQEMREKPYHSEDFLQQLLARYPNLLAGDQINDHEPRRWLLVAREMGIPGEPGGSERWSLDHLFLDQDAVPTLVEVKRSTDTRIRREVVGQMLDYAANAVLHWPAETLRARFEKTCEHNRLDPAAVLADFLPGGRPDEFWLQVRTNLQAGKLRLVFVADEIPQELRRVIEFLNEQMDPAEVLAVEVKQYAGEGSLKTLVPRLLGQTAAARQRKTGTSTRPVKIDEAAYLNVVRQCLGAEGGRVVERIIDWARLQGLALSFNQWERSASFLPIVETTSGPRNPLSVQSGGDVWVQMLWLRESIPFCDESKRKELCARLNDIPGVKIPEERMTGYPHVSVRTLQDEAPLQAFLGAMTWVVAELRAAGP